jgi:hypothetical protein
MDNQAVIDKYINSLSYLALCLITYIVGSAAYTVAIFLGWIWLVWSDLDE